MYRKFGAFCGLLFLLVPHTFALENQKQITLELNKPEVAVGSSFELTLRIKSKNENSINLSDINIPGLDSFDTKGTTTSFQSVIINDTMISESQEVFTLVPKKTGKFTLGPITNSGGTLKSNSVEVNVVESISASSFSSPASTPDISNDTNITQETNTLDTIIFTSGVAIIIILLTGGLWYWRRKLPKIPPFPKKESKKNQESPKFIAINPETALEQIKAHLQKKYSVKTEALTTQELLELEKNSDQKLVLQKCLLAIQLREYGNAEIHNSEILHLLEQYLSYEQSRTNP